MDQPESQHPMEIINNEAIQMDIKPKKNKEDKQLTNEADDLLSAEDQALVWNCDLKEKLIVKLQELDLKLYHLIQSNLYL